MAELECFDDQTLVDLLLAEYEVSPEQAREDACKTIAAWRDAKLITDC